MKLDTKKIGAFTEVPVHVAHHSVKAIPEDVSNNKYTVFKDDDTDEEKKYNFV